MNDYRIANKIDILFTYTCFFFMTGQLFQYVFTMRWTYSNFRKTRQPISNLIQLCSDLKQIRSHWTIDGIKTSASASTLNFLMQRKTARVSVPPWSCVQNSGVEDTVPAWFDASPRNHRMLLRSHPTAPVTWNKKQTRNWIKNARTRTSTAWNKESNMSSL